MQTAISIPECIPIHELQKATSPDQHLQHHKYYIIQGSPESRDQKPQDIRIYLTFRNDMTVTDGVIIKGRHILVLQVLQKQAL